MATSLKRRHRERVVRRGIGLVIESDFYATEAGRSHFADQLTGIRYCVQETWLVPPSHPPPIPPPFHIPTTLLFSCRSNFDAIFAYLTSTNYDFQYDINRGLRPRRSLKQAMEHEVNLYGIVQKEQLGMDKAVETGKYRMSRYGVTPDLLVVPPQLSLYMTITPEDKIQFKSAGQPNQSAFDAGTPFQARAFRGLGVVQSNPYEMSEDAEAVQMLQRHTQVGEYYIMSNQNKKFGLADTAAGVSPSPYTTVIYNEEEDRLEAITLETVYENLKLMLNAINDEFKNGLTMKDLFGSDNDIPISTAKGFKDAMKAEDLQIMLLRPFIEHTTLSAVVTVAGRDTGATLFGPADMQLSANTSTKTIEGHYTCHTKAVITKQQNVLVLRDIMLSSYVAGANCTFFTYADGSDNTFERRLNLDDGLDPQRAYASLIPVPIMKGKSVPTAFSFTGKGSPWEPMMTSDSGNAPFMADDVRAFLDTAVSAARGNVDAAALSSQAFMTEGDITNEVCFVGPHRKFSPYSPTKLELVPGQGHLGPDAVPGDKRWRAGESVSVETARGAIRSDAPGTSGSMLAISM